MFSTQRKIIKLGRSKAVIIPVAWFQCNHFGIGEKIQVFYGDSMIIIPNLRKDSKNITQDAIEFIHLIGGDDTEKTIQSITGE